MREKIRELLVCVLRSAGVVAIVAGILLLITMAIESDALLISDAAMTRDEIKACVWMLAGVAAIKISKRLEVVE